MVSNHSPDELSNKIAQITPEMVAAGVAVLADSGRLTGGPGSSEPFLAQKVFQAMVQASREPPK